MIAHKMMRTAASAPRPLCGRWGPARAAEMLLVQTAERVTCKRCRKLLGLPAAAPAPSPQPMLSLREYLRSYPGGIRQLGVDVLVPERTLRDFAAGRGVRLPWQVIQQVAAAPGWAKREPLRTASDRENRLVVMFGGSPA